MNTDNKSKFKTSGMMLISMYSDDSEEESAPDVGSQENQKCSMTLPNSTFTAVSKHPERLPLPSSIKHLFGGIVSSNGRSTETIPQDDPTLHDGRIRSFPHQRGNWSTYVYVPYEPGEGFAEMLDGLSSVSCQAGIELKTIQEPHISLTRTVILLHHWIESFVSSVKLKLSHFPRFTLILGPPAVYCNEERTRTFLGLKIETGHKNLCEIAHALDICLSEFRLPPFYEDPQFHMSVLWVVGDAQHKLEAMLPDLHKEFSLHTSENPNLFCIDVSQCMCKTGNKMFTFPMASL